MDASMQPLIDEQYERIADTLRSGTLFGQSIDTDNAKQMVVAAYFAGRTESDNHYREYRELDKLMAGTAL